MGVPGQPVQKLLRLHIHQLHLIGLVKYRIRDPLPHRKSGDGGHGVVQALDVPDIDRGIHVDTGLQQLLHILVTLGVTAARAVGMGKLVHQDQPGLPPQGRVQVKFPALPGLPDGKLLQPLQQRGSLGPGVRLDVPRHHIHAPRPGLMGRLEHGVGFPHTGGVAKKDFQFSVSVTGGFPGA